MRSKATRGQQSLKFDRRFLDKYAGSIISDPRVALVELVANAWDAYATEVEVTWPGTTGDRFKIEDNGVGMTRADFEARWDYLDYNRIEHQGKWTAPPPDVQGRERRVFGRNGRGRHAAFHFGPRYFVTTWRDGNEEQFVVARDIAAPLKWNHVHTASRPGHGTAIVVEDTTPVRLDAVNARAVLGARFLSDPGFVVRVNGEAVRFEDIPTRGLVVETIAVPGIGSVELRVIDSGDADRSTRRHGVAWIVNHRAVGECTWSGPDGHKLLDGRSHDAKRYTLILVADAFEEGVREDWTGFDRSQPKWAEATDYVVQRAGDVLDRLTQSRRSEATSHLRQRFSGELQQMLPSSRERWDSFVTQVVDQCPSLSEKEVVQLGGILAKLEMSQSKYALIAALHQLDSSKLDDLHQLLTDWSVTAAKAVLDEIEGRLKLIAELRTKAFDGTVDEVHELQPLFAQGLWMFGPEFESIEFTSNRGMTTVIRELFRTPETGSLLRPDFVILPDSSVGFYGRPAFDDLGNERGMERVVIVELKRPAIAIGLDQKNQVKRYYAELHRKGLLTDTTQVYVYLLGSERDASFGQDESQDGHPPMRLSVLLYSELIVRAERRMMNLHSKVKEAPMFKTGEADAFTTPPDGQINLVA